MSDDKLREAIAELQRVTDVSAIEGFGDRWSGHDFCHEQAAHDPTQIDDAIAEILNAVLSGRLVRAALAAAPAPQDEARREEVECTCGAGHGSLEGHTGWCDYTPPQPAPVNDTPEIEHEPRDVVMRGVDRDDLAETIYDNIPASCGVPDSVILNIADALLGGPATPTTGETE